MITRKKGRCVERQLNFTLINEHLQRTTALRERLRFSLPFCRSNETSKVQKPGKEDVMILKVFVQADDEETSLSQITRARYKKTRDR